MPVERDPSITSQWQHHIGREGLQGWKRRLPSGIIEYRYQIERPSDSDFSRYETTTNHVLTELSGGGFESYLVGGGVRDILLGIPPKDIDITTSATPEQVKEFFETRGHKVIETGIEHGTVTVMDGNEPIEITTFRTEGKYTDGRRPEGVAFTTNIQEDLQRRDFTINALVVDPHGNLVDYVGGIKDLQDRKIRAVGDAKERFKEDGLRPLRAARFQSKLGFTIEEKTLEAMKDPEVHDTLAKVSKERVRDEVLKAMSGMDPSAFVKTLLDTGLNKHVLPELESMRDMEQPKAYHKYDVLTHSIEAMKAIHTKDPVLRFVALLHDIAKPDTMQRKPDGTPTFHGHEDKGADKIEIIMRRLKFSLDEINRAKILVREHLLPYSPDMNDAAVRRIVNRVGEQHMDDLIELRRADLIAHGTENAFSKLPHMDHLKNRLQTMKAQGVVTTPKLQANGHEIGDATGAKGAELGKIISQLRNAITDDPSLNNKDKLLEMARRMVGKAIWINVKKFGIGADSIVIHKDGRCEVFKSIDNLDLVVEYPKGSMRHGVSRDGVKWSREMKHDYGRINSTKGADGEPLDFYMGPNKESEKVWVVNQIVQETGEFDEVKILLGFDSLSEAKAGYLAHYPKNWKIGNIKEINISDLFDWIDRGNIKDRFKDYCDDQNDCFPSPQALGGHVVHTGHSVSDSKRNHESSESSTPTQEKESDFPTPPPIRRMKTPFPHENKDFWDGDIVRQSKEAPVVNVALSDLISTQEEIYTQQLEEYKKNPHAPSLQVGSAGGWPDDLPVVVRQDNKNYIIDGHHRLTAMLVNGEKTANVRLIQRSRLGNYCDDQNDYFPSPQALGGHVVHAGHSVSDSKKNNEQTKPSQSTEQSGPKWQVPTKNSDFSVPILEEWVPMFGITQMSPDDYLKRIADGFGITQAEAERAALTHGQGKIQERLTHGLPLDPAWITYDVDTGEMAGQEGRNRAMVARRMGITSIPVVVVYRDANGRIVPKPSEYKAPSEDEINNRVKYAGFSGIDEFKFIKNLINRFGYDVYDDNKLKEIQRKYYGYTRDDVIEIPHAKLQQNDDVDWDWGSFPKDYGELPEVEIEEDGTVKTIFNNIPPDENGNVKAKVAYVPDVTDIARRLDNAYSRLDTKTRYYASGGTQQINKSQNHADYCDRLEMRRERVKSQNNVEKATGGSYCCNMGDCFDSPQALAGHISQTDHLPVRDMQSPLEQYRNRGYANLTQEERERYSELSRMEWEEEKAIAATYSAETGAFLNTVGTLWRPPNDIKKKTKNESIIDWAYEDGDERWPQAGPKSPWQWIQKLTTDEEHAIKQYVGYYAYRHINSALRDGKDLGDYQHYHDNLLSAYRKTPKFQRPATVWRGIRLDYKTDFVQKMKSAAQSGETITMKGWQSTSFSPVVALNGITHGENIRAKHTGVIFEIRTKEGMIVTDLAKFDDEDELIIEPDRQYKVIDVLDEVTIVTDEFRDPPSKYNGLTTIQLELV